MYQNYENNNMGSNPIYYPQRFILFIYNNMKWNNEEAEKLKELVSDGYRIKEISDILNRTNRSVERKIQNLNLTTTCSFTTTSTTTT